jgi:hypothetical protein
MGVGNRSTRRKPPTCRQSLTNCSVTNNLIRNIAVIPDMVFQFLTFDSNGQYSTWLHDKRNDCRFIITHFPQNSIIPTARVWSLICTPQSLHSNLQFIFRLFQRHPILRTKLLNHQTITYKVLNKLTPEYLNVFQYVSQVSSRITRQSVNNLLLYQKLQQHIIDVLLLYRHAIFGIICQMK